MLESASKFDERSTIGSPSKGTRKRAAGVRKHADDPKHVNRRERLAAWLIVP